MGGSHCPRPVSCGVPALLSGGLQGLHLHSPSPPCSAPGCWLPQGCCREHRPSPEILQHPSPGAGTRDNATSTRHNTLLPQQPLAIPVPRGGPGRGQGRGRGRDPLPSYCSDPSTTHTLPVLHPGPHGAASQHRSHPVPEPDAGPRVLSVPVSFPRPSPRGAGGRAPPGCRGGQVTPPCPAPAPGPAPAPSPRSARSSASVALRGEESGCWGPVCWGGGPGVGDEGSW